MQFQILANLQSILNLKARLDASLLKNQYMLEIQYIQNLYYIKKRLVPIGQKVNYKAAKSKKLSQERSLVLIKQPTAASYFVLEIRYIPDRCNGEIVHT